MGWSSTITFAMWTTVFAFFLQAVGLAIPFVFGVVVPVGDQTFYGFVGIWYTMSCVKGAGIDSCVSRAITPQLDISFSSDITGSNTTIIAEVAAKVLGVNVVWLVFQIVTTIGVGLCFLAFLIVICSACYRGSSKGMFIFACIMLFFSALIVLAVVALFGAAMALVFTFAFTLGSAENFPWSLLALGLGGILAIIASIALMVVTCNWDRHKYGESETESESGDVPMAPMNKGYENRGYDQRHAYTDNISHSHQYDRPYNYSAGGNQGYSSSGTGNYGYSYDGNQGYSSSGSHHYGSSQYEKPSYTKYPSSSENMYRPYSQNRY